MAQRPRKSKPKGPAGNPPQKGRGNIWTPTQDQREAARFLAATGATVAQVGKYLGVDYRLVERELKDEVENGREIADLALVGKLYRKAMGSGLHSMDGDTACLIFLAKSRLGMYDRPPVFGHLHPNDIPNTPQPTSAEVHVSVRYRYPSDPGSLPPPPLDRLPPTIEAEAKPA